MFLFVCFLAVGYILHIVQFIFTSMLFNCICLCVICLFALVGNYIYAGDNGGVNCYSWTQSAYASAREAVLQGPAVHAADDICSITFNHYRNVAHYYRGQTLFEAF